MSATDTAQQSMLHPAMEMAWKTAKLYNTCFAGAQREYGLSHNERDVLLFLHNNRGYDMASDIVKYRSISKSLVSRSVDSLTGRGFLEAIQTTGDRRQVHLRITPKASAAVAQLAQIQRHFFEMLGEDLTETERATFHQVMKKMGDNADRYSRKE